MLDLACFFTTGGVILFWKTFCDMDLSIVNEFVFKVLVQDRLSDKQFKIGNRVCIWKYDTQVKTVFLFAYDSMFDSFDLGEILSYTKSYYKKNVLPQVVRNGDLVMYIPDFNKDFDNILAQFKKKRNQAIRNTEASGKLGNAPGPRQGGDGTQERKKSEGSATSEDEADRRKEASRPTEVELQKATSNGILKDGHSPTEVPIKKSVSFQEDAIRPDKGKETDSPTLQLTKSTEKKLTPKEQMELKRKQEAESKKGAQSPTKAEAVDPKKSGGKVMRVSDKVTAKTQDALDYSKKFSSSQNGDSPQKANIDGFNAGASAYFDNDEEIDLDFNIVSSDDESRRKEGQKTKKSGILASFKSSFQKLAGGMVLTEENLESTLQKFKDDLMQKNVAQDIARGIVESLSLKLIGKKVGAFESLSELVKTTLKETLSKILMPKKNYDILSEASKAREKGEPYVIAFIGVNGVGKSTNLAKVAYLFKKQEFSVMFAACDNFRAGAVEQLKTHGRNLNVPVYDRGYKDEPHRIAKEAIKEARNRKIDVVLIDTAGRMQNNEPLMRALATLVTVNNPNLIVFIGEALVGNDGVDQLTNFNSALVKYSTEESNKREIDAILISKFDTVDEKVGAAISMTYATGKPILFFGTGQKYPNLKKPDVDSVVKMLLS